VIAVPVVWGGIEYLRSLGPLGFPWASMGYSQTPYLGIIQIAAAVGTYGLSAWIVLVNGLLASFIVSRRLSRLVAAVLVFVIPALAGQLALTDAEPHDGVRLSLIQPSISGSVKWDEAYRDSTMRLLTRMTLESPGSRMVVWPETAVPFYIEHVPSALGDVAVLAEHTGSSILFGFPDYEHTEAGERYYNSAMLITSEGEVAGKYSKIHLVPFGEMFPFEDRIELLRRINLGEGDFSPGEEHTIFEIDGRRFGVAICFESIYPGLVREFVRDGADFIVNVTNDEWFGPSLGPYQHAQMAIMRAVEYRIGVARCANTGISMFVDPFGRVTSKTDLFTRRILTGDVTFSAGRTSYLRVGRVIETGLLLVSLVLGGLSFLARRARRNSLTP
jgi:apolipoprotein N-acyltransferase